MTRTAKISKNTSIALTIALISVVTMVFAFSSFFSNSNNGLNTETIINQVPKQSSPPTNVSGLNESNSLNETNSTYNYSSAPVNTDSISLDPLNSIANEQTDPPLLSDSLFNNPHVPFITVPISLDSSNFITYSYCGYSVQQPDSTQFILFFPDNTDQGQIAGSDILTSNAFPIRKIDFNAVFISQKINALGFDEMVIFATSDVTTYKGVEFGVRLDLCDGFIYGYNQEPTSNLGEVDFQMMKLIPNDGIMHHYSLIIVNSEVSFYVDGIYYGCLSFHSNTDYSNYTFFILAVVHRFSDGWDSSGNNMMVDNFYLSQLQ
jgi:hypothetical protein